MKTYVGVFTVRLKPPVTNKLCDEEILQD